jgi:hypothetical protein
MPFPFLIEIDNKISPAINLSHRARVCLFVFSYAAV